MNFGKISFGVGDNRVFERRLKVEMVFDEVKRHAYIMWYFWGIVFSPLMSGSLFLCGVWQAFSVDPELAQPCRV